MRLRRALLALVLLPLVAAPGAQAALPTQSWPSAGHDLFDTRNNPDEHALGPNTVGALTQRWTKTFVGEVAQSPAVVNGTMYVSSLGGGGVGSSIFALDPATGATRWSEPVSFYSGVANDTTRATPAVDGGKLFFGTRVTKPGAKLIAADATDGHKLWVTQLDTHMNSIVTGAPTVANGVVYVGVSSSEDAAPTCCTFRGSVVALDEQTGAIKWRTMTAPVGYSGAAVWASNPVIDAATGLLYVGTGNNYSVPDGICQTPTQSGCTPPAADDYVDTVLALHLGDGSVAWSLRSVNADVWRRACKTDTSLVCGPDSDFGSGPNLFTATIDGVTKQVVGAGQKGGIYWAADAVTGQLVWNRRVSPGGSGGGIQWGTATDGNRIYFDDANSDAQPNTLPSGVTTTDGTFGALDKTTGAVVWQIPVPGGGQAHSFATSANDVMYVGSDLATGPSMFALSAATGRVLWSYNPGARVRSGATVIDGNVYWGAGNVLHAFGLPSSALHPDLVVSSVTATPATPTTGQPTRFVATLRNAGPAATAAGAVLGFKVKVDGATVASSEADTTSLASGDSVTLTTDVPWTATSGTHAVVVQADDGDHIVESDDANNTLTTSLRVGPPAPDLVVTSISTSPASPAPGTATRFVATVKNQGTAVTPAGTILGVVFKVDGTATSFSDTDTTSLAPGASVTLTANGGTANGPNGLWTATTGVHTVLAQVDDQARIAESDETNNTLSTQLTVGTPLADLIVTDLTWTPASPVAGSGVRFTATVQNVGTKATPAGTIVGVLFKVDSTAVTFSDSDTTALAPGASVVLTANGGTSTYPDGRWTATSGRHVVIAQVDDQNRIVESHDGNNNLAKTLTVP